MCASPAKAGKYALVFWHVKCTQCMLTLKDMHTSEEAVTAAWNTRMSEQDKRNEGKRWSKKDYYEIVNLKTGEVLKQFREYDGPDDDIDVDIIPILKEYGFNWSHYDFARRVGTDISFSGKHRIHTELRYYDDISWRD
ncbi:hypothetical protein pEaSNUABM37_00048 [Erwinia phage pEa_SNUABM_37]|nr:hypothetical protein pEaSNUABM37_00048 [Erwinia phage pEa_SNUABM_37]QXO10518.1 hypothetical protein pEaSNUABM48_00048 [Erwinia phage pEa_SNUABM_48]